MQAFPHNLVQLWQSQPGDSWFVLLGGGQLPEVKIGPYDNPANAKRDAKRFEKFLSAMAGEPCLSPSNESPA